MASAGLTLMNNLSHLWCLTNGTQATIEIYNLDSGWAFYPDLAERCDKTQTPIDVFTVDLEFGWLDE